MHRDTGLLIACHKMSFPSKNRPFCYTLVCDTCSVWRYVNASCTVKGCSAVWLTNKGWANFGKRWTWPTDVLPRHLPREIEKKTIKLSVSAPVKMRTGHNPNKYREGTLQQPTRYASYEARNEDIRNTHKILVGKWTESFLKERTDIKMLKALQRRMKRKSVKTQTVSSDSSCLGDAASLTTIPRY